MQPWQTQAITVVMPSHTSEGASSPQRPTRSARNIEFITMLRGIACLLVVWCHLGAGWVQENHINWLPNTLVTQAIVTPLQIEGNFGTLGVFIFFFVSGFIITHVAQRESHLPFLIKRVFRIFPPLAVAVVITYVSYAICLKLGIMFPAGVQVRGTASPGDLLLSATLFDRILNVPSARLVGVSWTLVVEVLFYAIELAFLTVLRRAPVVASLTALAVCVLFVTFGPTVLGPFGANLADYVQYIPLLLLGQMLYFRWADRIDTRTVIALLIVGYAAAMYCLSHLPSFYLAAMPLATVSAAYAFGIFTVALLASKHLRVPKALTFFGTISYSLYLTHVSIGQLFYYLLQSRFPDFTLAFMCAILLVTAFASFTYVAVERPSQNFARAVIAQLARLQRRGSRSVRPPTIATTASTTV